MTMGPCVMWAIGETLDVNGKHTSRRCAPMALPQSVVSELLGSTPFTR